MYYLNRKIENLVRIFDQNERKSYLRLDLNENPGGLPEEFVNGVLGDVTPQLIAQYPETLHFTEVLAQYLGTDIQHLCLVNGSAEGIRYIIQAFTSENGKLLAWFLHILCFRFIQRCMVETLSRFPIIRISR